MRAFNKLFVTSLPRCATVSICRALAELGIPMMHLGKRFECSGHLGEIDADSPEHFDAACFNEMVLQLDRGDPNLRCLELSRGMADYPACSLNRVRKLREQYPDSLFIHVARNRDMRRWLRSVERHFGGLDLLNRTALDPVHRKFREAMHRFRYETFGAIAFDEDGYRQAYQQHQTTIDSLACREPDRWLLFDDVADLSIYGYARLSGFLEVPIMNQPFPHCDAHSRLAAAAFEQAVVEGRIQSQIR